MADAVFLPNSYLLRVKRNDLDIDNTALVEECRAGDREAMSLLYSRFAPRMLRVIARYVDDKDDAQDILHDGFIAAFTRMDTLREPERVEYWLATIMKNLSLKFLQSQNIELILDSLPMDLAEDSDIDEVIDFETLESLIKQLPDGYQKVFRLAVLENKSHKEISKILGIAPNSSSSQLFHAKIMIRKLINEYRKQTALMILLLLVILCDIVFLPRYEDLTQEKPLLSIAEQTPVNSSNQSQIAIVVQQDKPDNNSGNSGFYSKEKTSEPTAESSQPMSTDDATGQNQPVNSNKEKSDSDKDKTETYEELIAESPVDNDVIEEIGYLTSKHARGWSAGIAFNSGLLSFDNLNSSYGYETSPPPSDPDQPNNPDDNETCRPVNSPRAKRGLIEKLRDLSHKNYPPMTISLTAERRFSSWFGMETGISYTYLRTDFEDLNVNTTCHWHYLELPLRANFYVYHSSLFSFYGSLGAKLSVPVYSNASPNSRLNIEGGRFNSNTVWSVGGSLGVSYRLSDRLHLYLEPSLQYHFPHDYMVPNTWTDDPWTFSIPIGIRFSW